MPGKKVNLDHLLEKAVVTMKRDITHIYEESDKGKLTAGSARDLVNYVKALSSVIAAREDVEEDVAKTDEEELKKLAKELIGQ